MQLKTLKQKCMTHANFVSKIESCKKKRVLKRKHQNGDLSQLLGQVCARADILQVSCYLGLLLFVTWELCYFVICTSFVI